MAQEKSEVVLSGKGQQAVYLELLGNGGLGTLNWDCFLTDHLVVRAGGLILPTGDNTLFIGTLDLHWVWGKTKHKLRLETGLGVSVAEGGVMREDIEGLVGLTGTIGIRYQPKPKGLLMRLSFNPILTHEDGNTSKLILAPWGGLSIGYSF